jgi:putative ABC transport system permease protein
MDWLRQASHRFRALFRRRNLESEMAEEMRLHLEHRENENLAAGLAPAEARLAAQRAFGGVTQIQEQCRDERQFGWLEDFARDMRFAARQLRRRPGFTFVATLTLGLGIGATTAIFGVIHGILLKPLPFGDPERLVGVYHRGPGLNLPLMNHGANAPSRIWVRGIRPRFRSRAGGNPNEFRR